MSPHESNLILNLTDEVKALRAEMQDTRAEMSKELTVIRVKLFGDDDRETEQGRIPRLEASIKTIKTKLARIEPVRWALNGLWLFLLAVVGFVMDHFLAKGH